MSKRKQKTPGSSAEIWSQVTCRMISEPNAAISYEIHRSLDLSSALVGFQNNLSRCSNADQESISVDVVKRQVDKIQEACWNSPEFWLPKTVPTINVGVIGCPRSGRNRLIKEFLGSAYSFVNDELGSRSKCQIELDGVKYLLILREESAAPSIDFTKWVDTLVVVGDGGATTTVVETYVNHFVLTRPFKDVFVVLAALKRSRISTMSFIPRFKLIKADAPLIEANLMTKQNIQTVFEEACRGFIRKRLTTPAFLRTPSCATPFSHYSVPVSQSNMRTPAYHATPCMSSVDTRSASRFPQATNFTPKCNVIQVPSSFSTNKRKKIETAVSSKPSASRSERKVTFGEVRTARDDVQEENNVVFHPSWTNPRRHPPSEYLKQAVTPRTSSVCYQPHLSSSKKISSPKSAIKSRSAPENVNKTITIESDDEEASGGLEKRKSARAQKKK